MPGYRAASGRRFLPDHQSTTRPPLTPGLGRGRATHPGLQKISKFPYPAPGLQKTGNLPLTKPILNLDKAGELGYTGREGFMI